jgi:hypothetical protein
MSLHHLLPLLVAVWAGKGHFPLSFARLPRQLTESGRWIEQCSKRDH